MDLNDVIDLMGKIEDAVYHIPAEYMGSSTASIFISGITNGRTQALEIMKEWIDGH